MKRILLFTVACALFLRGGAWAAEIPSVRTLSSIQAPRVDVSTGLIDFWQLGQNGAPQGRLMSLFGYNAGSAAFVEIFNTASTNPVIRISGFDENNLHFTNAVPGILALGDALQLTNTLGGITAGIYWVIPEYTNTFFLADSRAHALAGSPVVPSGSSAAANVNLVPVHSFKMAATDNFSFVIPTTGLGYSRGLLIATSTTGGTYTVAGTNITALVTIGSP